MTRTDIMQGREAGSEVREAKEQKLLVPAASGGFSAHGCRGAPAGV